MDTMQAKSTLPSKLVWSLVAIIGAISFGMLALSRGEHVNAVWLVLAAAWVCIASHIDFIVYLLQLKYLN